MARILDVVEHLEKALVLVRRNSVKRLIICGDFQMELPPNIQSVTGPCARGKAIGMESNHLLRQQALIQVLIRFGLFATNTAACVGCDPVHFVTRAAIGRSKQTGTQLDYIFTNESSKYVWCVQ